MAFIISDLADDERSIAVNVWNWHPTVELIRTAGLLEEERLEGLDRSCSGTCVTAEEARAIARHLRDIVLPSLATDARVLLDGTSTTDPDDGTLYRSPEDFDRNYSATRAWLEKFAAFCESCGGFESD